MPPIYPGRTAILYPGDRDARTQATPENNRFSDIFKALTACGLHAEPAVYNDDFCDVVRQQLLNVDAVLVWMNPIQEGKDRSILDNMLRDIAQAGVFVSTHPDIILKLGTKEVLYRTRHMRWGCDTRLYRNISQLQQELPLRLASGHARVLKQYRGNGGLGVWKVQWPAGAEKDNQAKYPALPQPDTLINVRQAKRGSMEETIPLDDLYSRCKPYFKGDGRVIDQAYQSRLPEGMIRCYLVQDRVVGFGHQAVNMLYPAPPGASPKYAPLPGPRLYYPPDLADFQELKAILEHEWIPELQQLMEIPTEDLPILWDCDFLLGPKTPSGRDTYVLCEINVSSVAPFPDSAPPYIAEATLARIEAMRKSSK